MSDLKRTPARAGPVEYPAAIEALRDRRGFLALLGRAALVAAVPNFAAACMGALDPEPVNPGADTFEDVEGEFPYLSGDQPAPDTIDKIDDVEDEFPPLAGEPIMPDTIQPHDVKDIEDEFPPLAGGIRMPDAVHGDDGG